MRADSTVLNPSAHRSGSGLKSDGYGGNMHFIFFFYVLWLLVTWRRRQDFGADFHPSSQDADHVEE